MQHLAYRWIRAYRYRPTVKAVAKVGLRMQSPRSIVVIDDDRDFLKIIVAVLRVNHYRAIAHLGEAGALELIVAEAPGLVIVDMLMEHTESGLRISRALQQNPATAGTPVVVCSGETNTGEKIAALNADRYVYLKKPFQPAQLLALIERLLAH